MRTASITASVVSNLDDLSLSPAVWNGLLEPEGDRGIFMTCGYQRAWWKVFGRGRLLPVVAFRDNTPCAIAPLFADGGMIFLVGSGGSDYLDIVGRIDDEGLAAMLNAARNHVQDFVGFRFYHVLEDSPTIAALQSVSENLGLVCVDEGDLPAPALDLSDTEFALAATRKKSLLRHERHFERTGDLVIHHFSSAADILPCLPAFFDQHIRRWRDTAYPSLFNDPKQRRFYERLTEVASEAGWLRFTRVHFDSRPIAFHYGFCHRGVFMWYKPSFEIDLAKRSPGEVLLRQLLLRAIEEGAHTFDFGLGDEPFKQRFATRTRRVRTLGLYLPEGIRKDEPQ